ncbi:MAG: pantoate--beta-alanine ligase [Verrucomicrobia bacterium RIFCSPHIGHO2_12_FULL_41_10]|nr:MAG: pantoate--beta-alanine ligase [Verrucomicrobia bacterium RIFCSPHIGHO2_12_FULL_41_10]HLB34443.1 pantoate--beta-alanine ligase [Chthoniobacterales bacterium]
MKLVTTVAETRAFCRQAPRPLVLCTTMGSLHEGHASIMRHARSLAGPTGTVVVSIFVNPLQFGPHEDLARYPRTLEADQTLCAREKVDLIFHPSVEEMISKDASVVIEERSLSQELCGRSRPGHFSGVTTIVAKFFNITTPDITIFGEKDWQQLALIRRMVRDLNFPIEVVGYPIVREKNCLALSSRNTYLSEEERLLAPQIYQALCATAKLVSEGEDNVAKLLKATKEALRAIPHTTIDYVSIVDSNTLEPLSQLIPGKIEARLIVAITLGHTRLLDNISIFGQQAEYKFKL